METKELKQGNWIEYQNKNFQVIGFDSDQVLIRDSFDFLGLAYIYSKNINPIPITEDWLLKFGFIYVSKIQHSELYGYWLNGFHIEMIGDMFMERKYGIHIQYIHQLQNLFYSITQTELQCKTEENGSTLE